MPTITSFRLESSAILAASDGPVPARSPESRSVLGRATSSGVAWVRSYSSTFRRGGKPPWSVCCQDAPSLGGHWTRAVRARIRLIKQLSSDWWSEADSILGGLTLLIGHLD